MFYCFRMYHLGFPVVVVKTCVVPQEIFLSFTKNPLFMSKYDPYYGRSKSEAGDELRNNFMMNKFIDLMYSDKRMIW